MSETGSGQPGMSPGRENEKFPRSPELSFHSPIFWVENKDRFLRQLLIRDIEEHTKRRLCVFFCSPYFNTSLISDDIARLYEIVHDEKDTPFDLLLETNGGETDATQALTAMLRKISRDFRVIVPSRAKSNGTVICLSGESILMGPTSELGPIEPYLSDLPVSILVREEYKKIDFELHCLGQNALNQTTKLTTDLLKSGMLSGRSDEEVEEVVKKLCTREHFPSHGSVIDSEMAKSLGLCVVDMNPTEILWSKVWLLHSMYAYDSNARGVGKFFVIAHVSWAGTGSRASGSGRIFGSTTALLCESRVA